LSMSPSTQISQHSIVAWSFYHKYSNNLKQYQTVILALNCYIRFSKSLNQFTDFFSLKFDFLLCCKYFFL